MNWFLLALTKYATFSGRSRRKEYWYFVLFYILIFAVLAFVDGFIGMFNAASGFGLLSGIFSLALLLPSFAVTVRRLHDTDHSGWWFLIALVQLVGSIVLLVFCVQDITPSDNRFGPNPKLEN